MTQEHKRRWDAEQGRFINYVSKGVLACSFKHEVDGRSERVTGLLLENTSKYDEVREILEENGVKAKEGSKSKLVGTKAQDKKPRQADKDRVASFINLVSDDEEDGGPSQKTDVKDVCSSPSHYASSASDAEPVAGQYFEAKMTIIDVPLYALEMSGVWERNEIAEALFRDKKNQAHIAGSGSSAPGADHGEQDAHHVVGAQASQQDRTDHIVVIDSDIEDENVKEDELMADDCEGEEHFLDDTLSDAELNEDEAGGSPSLVKKEAALEVFTASTASRESDDPSRLGGMRVLEASAQGSAP